MANNAFRGARVDTTRPILAHRAEITAGDPQDTSSKKVEGGGSNGSRADGVPPTDPSRSRQRRAANPSQVDREVPRVGILKIQVTLDAYDGGFVEKQSIKRGASNAAVVREAIRVFAWCSKMVDRGFDIVAINSETDEKIGIYVPHIHDIDFTVTPVEVTESEADEGIEQNYRQGP